MKKKKLFIKAVSLVMAIIMTLAVLPVQAISLQQENADMSNETLSAGDIEKTDQEVFIVEEDTSKRDQFEKHYLCSDGTYVSVTYPETIHYLDDNNVWQDVDQSLTYNGTSDVYSSDNADFNVSFAAKGSSSNIVRIEKDGYVLSWGIQAAGKTPLIVSDSAIDKSAKTMSAAETIISIPASLSSANLVSMSIPEFDKNADRLITNEDSFVLPNISSQISYTSVFGEDQNVTLSYTVYHNKIEEDIIISERGDIHSVSMNMDIGTLTPVVNSDGSVDLVDDDNNMQFHVGIPYMVDAAFSVCNDIQVTAKKDGSNCIITYTPNAEWFDSVERVFPVLLDPSITTNDYVVNMVDTYVEENSTTNHSSEQYLYINKNGSNRRKAIVRIRKLPQIDASMPIVSASLSLTAQTAPTSSISLNASYYDSALELSEYTYNIISDIPFTYTTSSYLNSGSKTVTFDLSSHIYEMYSDLEFDIEEGYDYYGDFIISFSDNNNSTALAPFYSANYTTPASRPVFTVKYGYTLPAGMMNGGVYSFQNVGSFSYMTVSGNPPANKSNVIQIQNDSWVATASQKFRLVYSSETGGYRLYSENTSAGSDLVLAILRNSVDIKPNRNVHVTSPGDPISDEWLIVPIDYYVFRIVPRANMSLALTVCGDQDGTSNGKTPTSPGNVFVATVDENEEYQEWFIYDSNDNDVTAEDSPSTMETGNYYISNKYTGRYLHRTNNLGNCMSGTISSLGDETVNWKVVNLGDGYCTIQRSDIAGYFLATTGPSNGSGVKVYQKTTGEIPDNYKWAITSASGGGCLIQNKASGYYLYAENPSANPSSVTVRSLYASGTDNYKRQVWRVANEDYYVELGIAASFNDIAIDINDPKSASINKSPSSATWASYTDFDYTITSGGNHVTYNSTTHKFTAQSVGTASVTAVHKTTGLTDSFTIKVNNNAIIIIPGILGSELYVGSGNPYFEEDMPLFSKEIINGLSSYQDGDTVQALIPSNWWDGLNNIPSAVRLFNAWSDSMSCNDNGSSMYNVYVKEYRSADPSTRTGNHCGTGDAYLNLYTKLVTAYSSEYSIDLFSYDWRLSNAVSASKLDDYIEYYNYDKVILIAHSMGGLVASGYLGLGASQRDKVEQVFYLASPLLGTPTVANVWYNEDISFVETTITDAFGISVEDFNRVYKLITGIADPIKNLICNYVSIYELFPSAYYFQLTGASYMSDSFTTIMIGGETTLTECSTYAATKSILTGYFDDFDSNLMAMAEAFHNTTFISGNHVSSYVDSRYYHCLNTSVATISHLKFYQIVSSTSYAAGLEVDGTTNNGDFLVLTTSSTLANRYPAKCLSFSGDHMSLVMTSTVIDQWIPNIS